MSSIEKPTGSGRAAFAGCSAFECWDAFYQWRRHKWKGEPCEYWRNEFEESARRGVERFGLDDFLQAIRGQEFPLGNNAINAVRRLVEADKGAA